MDNGTRRLIKTHIDAILLIINDSKEDELVKWSVNSNLLQIKQTLQLDKE